VRPDLRNVVGDVIWSHLSGFEPLRASGRHSC
jgi:hypothetical protein